MHPLELFKFCPVCGSPHFEIHNEKSKKCADCGFVYYFNSSAATVAFILYSGFLVHTLDQFFLCQVEDDHLIKAMDDVADAWWMPLDKVNPDDFGLDSVRKGVARFLETCRNKK